ncbi:MAG TPA: NADH-quinone oxidoreductase subunit NuoH [Chloroflexota bacterium]|jgi:NADH-quinone oxidoreductase subunit H|nr:NADH-quinone oxidoreductase subunit NuoH [Chloroflexota bacterium]
MEWYYPLIVLAKVVIVLTGVSLSAYVNVYFFRKELGRMQSRMGPNRVGPEGLLQSLADSLKMLVKEDTIPAGADKTLFKVAPGLLIVPIFVAFAVVPFSNDWQFGSTTLHPVISQTNVGLLIVLALTSMSVYGVVMGGWASNNKYGMMGSLRASAQLISYEVTLGLSVIGVVMLSHSLNLEDIVAGQASNGFWTWYIVRQLPAFIIFFAGIMAESARPPFDLPEAESELIAGYHVEYSGARFFIYQTAEWSAMLLWVCVAVLLFFGGWLPPFSFLGFIPGWLWFIAKCYALIFTIIWIGATWPRFRYDQLMTLNWKVLLPMGVANFFIVAIWKTVAASLGVGV